jgi:hypothetical protein
LAGGPSPEHHDALSYLKARFAESMKISDIYYILSRKIGCPAVDRRNQVCPEGHAIGIDIGIRREVSHVVSVFSDSTFNFKPFRSL